MNELKNETWNELKAFVDGLITENERLKEVNKQLEEDIINATMNCEHFEKIFEDFVYALKATLIIDNEENTVFFDYDYVLKTIDEVKERILR